jgi:hypothetical protein
MTITLAPHFGPGPSPFSQHEPTNTMKHFFSKLLPPRSSFVADMTSEERKIMQEHAAYWKSLLNNNVPIVYGPVVDPQGAFGISVFRAAGEPEARAIVAEDPAIKANAGFTFELFPMGSAVYRE